MQFVFIECKCHPWEESLERENNDPCCDRKSSTCSDCDVKYSHKRLTYCVQTDRKQKMKRMVFVEEPKDICLNRLNHKRHIRHKAGLKHLINHWSKAIGNTSQGKYVAKCIQRSDISHIFK